MEKKRKYAINIVIICTLIALFVYSLVFLPVVAQPPSSPYPKAMNLSADRVSICLNGDTAIITATVFNQSDYTEPMPNIGVNFNTSLGSLTNISFGGSFTPDHCWALTDGNGAAIVLLTSGSTEGVAEIRAWIGGADLNRTIEVKFIDCNVSDVPAITPIGLIALISALSAIAAITITQRKRR